MTVAPSAERKPLTMSLDVYLEIDQPTDQVPREAIFIRRDGATVEITRKEWDELHPGRQPVAATITVNPGEPETVFSRNITHNLGKMADAAGIYQHLWRPEEIMVHYAWQLIEPMSAALERLKADPSGFRRHNPPNGWGDYEGLVAFVDAYIAACREYPDAKVSVWR